MSIGFNQIPDDIRTHGAFIEFNNELAGVNFLKLKSVLLGQRLATAEYKSDEPVRVTRPDQAKKLFGRGSMIAVMVAAAMLANPELELWVAPIDDNSAGQAASGTITVTTAPSGAGTLYVYLGGERVPVGINHGDTANLVATSIAAAISAGADLPVTASVSDNVVTVTARHKGEVFNGYDLRASYYNEQLPAGLSLSFASLSGGSGNPDIQDTLDMLGDTWFNWGINPYTDTANLVTLEAELLDRWGPMRQIGCRMFSAIAGSHGTATTFGSSRNSHLISCLGLGSSPTPAFIAAAINGAVAAGSLSIDPARPLQTLRLPGLLAPISSEQWIRQERNLALYDGISTYTVERDGTCRIGRQITMYQTNASGYGDASYLDITTPETLERIRFEQLAMRAQKFPRHKLADDGTNFGEGQAIVTPKVWRGELLALYKFMETTRGWVEDYKTYEKSLLVERPTYDRNRLNWRDNPNLVNGAIVLAGQNQFIV